MGRSKSGSLTWRGRPSGVRRPSKAELSLLSLLTYTPLRNGRNYLQGKFFEFSIQKLSNLLSLLTYTPLRYVVCVFIGQRTEDYSTSV